MSDMYAIKASTLSALGDAVRAKKGEMKSLSWSDEFSNVNIVNIYVPMYEGKKYRLTLTVEHANTNYSSVEVLIADGNNYRKSFQVNQGVPKQIEITPTVDEDYIWFRNSLTTLTGNYILEMLDEDGNVISHTYTPLEMVDELNALEIPVIEPVVLTGNCQYACSGGMGSAFIKNFPDKISTKNISNAGYMFYKFQGEEIPFDINFEDGTSVYMAYMFSESKLKQIPNITYKGTSYQSMGYLFNRSTELEELPYIFNAYPSDMSYMFYGCNRLRNIPEDYFDTWNFSAMNASTYYSMSNMFYGCWSLRNVPTSFLKSINSKSTSSYYLLYNYGFSDCYSLDEIIGFPVMKGALSSNALNNTFDNTFRLKRMTFNFDENTYAWKNQTFHLTKNIGWLTASSLKTYILDYNSGITADKEVVDDATYQALKDDPDWFTCDIKYSRYNHDSAVETINSLPDVTGGSGNTIVFKGEAGELTDGGAINTLTDAEIAVAAAKGWTVVYQ